MCLEVRKEANKNYLSCTEKKQIMHSTRCDRLYPDILGCILLALRFLSVTS